MAKRSEIGGRSKASTGPSGPAEPVQYPAKLSSPARHSAVIHRQRLIDLLSQQAASRRVTIVSAPAGYGKTTLLYDFAQGWEAPVCWYALDERDRDLTTFLTYWVASGQTRFDGFGSKLVEALGTGDELAPERWVDLIVSAIEEVELPFLLVLDDSHYLDEAEPPLREVLDGWVYRLPPNCHLVLCTRTQPEVGVLPLMMVRQEVGQLSAADFAFTCEEVVQLYREVLNKELSLDDAQHLADVSEGWAAALILMTDKVQAARTKVTLEQLKASDTLFQYINLEQFSVLPEEVREFLVSSAVPREIEPARVNALLEIENTEEMLSFLERRNLFVSREGTDGQSYRYHKLFRYFLVSRLRSEVPQRFLELNRKAAEMFDSDRRWEEAVYHLLQAGDWERIVEVTERVGRDLFEQGRWDTLADWLESIPQEEMEAQPKLVLWKARILHHLNQLDQALATLAPALQAFEAKGDWVSLSEALVTKGMCLRFKGAYHEAIEALGRARSLLLKHDGPMSVLTEARKELGITHGMAGEFDKAEEELKSVLSIYQAQGDAYNIAHVSDQLGVMVANLGRLSEAIGHLERARQRWLKLGNDEMLIQTLTNLGMLYHHQGELERAEEVTQQGLEKARERGSVYAEAYLEDSLGSIQRGRGRPVAATEHYQRALGLARELDDSYLMITAMDALARAQLMAGNVAEAEATALRAAADADERGGVFERGVCRISKGLIERERGQLKGAATSLEEAVGLLRGGQSKRELTEAYFHLAEVHYSLKRKRMALEYLESVAKLVGELGYDHFLHVEAARVPLLVQYAAAHKLADGYYARMLKAVKRATPQLVQQTAEEEAAAEAIAAGLVAFGFGNPRVELNGREVSDLEWRSEKSKEMFFFFLCNRRPLRKEEIVTALWPDMPDDKTTSLFHSNLYRLRQALYPECVGKDSGRYVLDPSGGFRFDVDEFLEALKAAEGLSPGSDEAIALMEKAISRYAGQFASAFYTEWVETLRWQLEEQHMRLLTTLAAAYTERGEYKRSADLCQRILGEDEYNEAAWYRLMSNYVLADQTEAAQFCYRKYAEIVSEGLGEGGVPEFEEICQQIKSEH